MKITNPMTCGEFVDAMAEVAKINEITETAFELWAEYLWGEHLSAPLSEDRVQNFVNEMVEYFQEVIHGTCGDELYTKRHNDGHTFLRAIHAKLRELGINADLAEVDLPLTPTDLAVALGVVKAVKRVPPNKDTN